MNNPKLPKIAISSSSASLPSCAPNLMPFSIDYNGTAPVSTFLRIEDAKRNIGAPEVEDSEGPESQEITVDGAETSQLADTIAKLPLPSTSSASSLEAQKEDLPKRFISTFRGRTIHGLEVHVPEGYTGVLFRSEGYNKGGANSGGEDEEATGSRTTRRSSRRVAAAIDVDAEDENDEAPMNDITEEDQELQTTTLDASMRFSSFVLWHPDIPVDTGKDEYFATVSEWMKVAHAIHCVEED
ncbi:hypothetical protein Moror_16072 [Moniliophthora roreri MCA 2997]|uniref:Uncharacterized protein n=1 Tax=Moniliophthora roreri (strain MCA 2997) TaxID=1381753 RepID=V2WRM1_MONRO|nr:hypothetical protein Moror_16072 [Moniliophthora roreri MCA 2997]